MVKFERPTLVTLTAPTCAGKSHILDALTNGGDDAPFSRIVSTTTRQRRANEAEGVDYFFISTAESRRLEETGQFAELIEFRGIRYGVTEAELEKKINGSKPPIVICEPVGMTIYQQLCFERGWDIYRVFVYTPESTRIERLKARALADLAGGISPESVIKNLTDRLLSATGDERRWQAQHEWDLLIPGDDLEHALKSIQQGIKWRNYRNSQLNT